MCAEPLRFENDSATSNIVGKVLLNAGLVDAEGLARAVIVKDRYQTSLGEAIAQLGLADEEAVSAAIARHLHFDYLNPQVPDIADSIVKLISSEFCRKR